MSALREVFASYVTRFDGRELEQGDRKTNQLISTLQRLGQVVAVGAVVQGIRSFVESTVQMTTELGRQSTQLGITTHDLQAYRYAASQVGMPVDQLSDGLLDFIERAGEAAIDGGEAAEAFKRIGVQTRDAVGNIRPLRDMLGSVADGIRRLPTRNAQLFTVRQIFGDEAGGQILPLLDRGADGIARLTGEFDRMGGGVSSRAVEAGANFARTMAQVEVQVQAIVSVLAEAFLPMLASAATYLGNVTQALSGSSVLTEAVRIGLALLATAAIAATVALVGLAASWIAAMGPFALLLPLIGGLVYLLMRLVPQVDAVDSAVSHMGETAERTGNALGRLGVSGEQTGSSLDQTTRAIDQTGQSARRSGEQVGALRNAVDGLRTANRQLSEEERSRQAQEAYGELSAAQRREGIALAIERIEQQRRHIEALGPGAEQTTAMANLDQWLERLRGEQADLTRRIESPDLKTRKSGINLADFDERNRPGQRGSPRRVDTEYEVGMTRAPGYDPLAFLQTGNQRVVRAPATSQTVDARQTTSIIIQGDVTADTVDVLGDRINAENDRMGRRLTSTLSRSSMARATGRQQ